MQADKFIIVWAKTGKYADINDWHEPNTYNSELDAIQATSTWLFPYCKGYYSVIKWDGQVDLRKLK